MEYWMLWKLWQMRKAKTNFMSKLKSAVNKQDHQIGNPNARVVLLEYGDYQCPHCGIAHPLIKKLLKDFDRNLLFVFRNFPLQEMHPAAVISALAAEAAGKQNKFWEMHDMIYENQSILSPDSLIAFAERLQLNLEKFNQDWNSKEMVAKVETDFESGVRAGVNGTPGFYLNELKLETYDESYESLASAVDRFV
jgi:protein-disulfide isomerase